MLTANSPGITAYPFVGIQRKEINRVLGVKRRRPMDSLADAKRRCLNQAAVMNGLTDESGRQNWRLLKIIQAAGTRICQQMPNEVYGLFANGSRVKGYHDLESDIDLYFVVPDSANSKNKADIAEDIIRGAIKKEGMGHIKADFLNSTREAEFQVNDFARLIESDQNSCNLFFGFSLCSNPNLLLAQLSCLEVLMKLDWRDNLWAEVRKQYRNDYLRIDSAKLAERLRINKAVVEGALNKYFYRERFRKFDLPGYLALKIILLKEYHALAGANLESYKMYEVYQSVKGRLLAGF